MDEPTTLSRVRTTPHILSSASTMVGVSITLIGLVKVVEARIGPSHVDEYAGLAAALFLLGAVSAYLSMRLENRSRASLVLERVAETLFIVGLAGITGIALFFAYELI